MRDFVVYHNPDSMGYAADKLDTLAALTNKTVGDVIGDRLWLITGDGRPRRFKLCMVFTIDIVESGREDGFRTRLSGSSGKIFDPMPELNDEDWFPDFKKSLGNFSWGFSPIRDPSFIEGLERVAT